jgi:hypothetical protein
VIANAVCCANVPPTDARLGLDAQIQQILASIQKSRANGKYNRPGEFDVRRW